MSFNSYEFAIFFPIILLLVRVSSGWLRLSVLLAANALFLQVLGFKHVAFMMSVILVSYFAGLLLDKFTHKKKRKAIFLASSITLAAAPLVYFKYYGFISCISNLLNGGCSATGYVENYSAILPLGISFYTLQGISYIFDVYYSRTTCEKNFLYFANFKSFFPQLVAGPIERASTLLPQFKRDFKASEQDLKIGFAIMAWGFFKKIVIADNLTIVVDPVFADPQNFDAPTLAVAVLAFTIQIYCDFSGYVNIATGAARMLGIKLSINFNNPYFATSVSNFWHRWHISLSTWFRDYVYLPIGGNKNGFARMYLGLMLVFLISGIWHGANFTFIIWAGIHLVAVVAEKILGVKLKDEVVKLGAVQVAHWIVTLIIVMLGWIFFRSNSVSDGIYIVSSIFSAMFGTASSDTLIGFNVASMQNLTIGIVASVSVFTLEYMLSFRKFKNSATRFLSLPRSSVFILAIVMLTIAFGNFGRSSFIYFQF